MSATTFGKRILSIRKTKGMNQQEFANLVGLHSTTLSGYELGKSKPSKQTVMIIAKALKITEKELLSRVDRNSLSRQAYAASNRPRDKYDDAITELKIKNKFSLFINAIKFSVSSFFKSFSILIG